MYSISLVCLALIAVASVHAFNIDKRADAEACSQVPIEVGIVLDSSSSIWDNDFALGKKFLQDLVNLFTVGPTHTRFSLILFGRGIYTDQAFDLDKYATKDSLLAALDAVNHKHGDYTSTGKGIDYMRENQLSADKVRPGVPRVGVVITDGNSQEWKQTAAAATQAVSDGIDMIAIGVGHGVNPQELLRIAGGNSSRVITATKFSELGKILAPLKEKICQPIPTLPPTTPAPKTEECKLAFADVYFVFSQSALGLERTSWTAQFISSMIGADKLGSGYRYGIISDSCDGGFDLGSINRIGTIQTRLLGYEEFQLPSLVQKLVEKGYPTGCGNRAQVAIIFTGAGQKAVTGIQDQVTDLVGQGVTVFVVDLSGEGLVVDGAQTLVGESAITVASQLVGILCVE